MYVQSVRVRLVATLHTLSVRGCYNLHGMLKKRNRTGTRENLNLHRSRDDGVQYKGQGYKHRDAQMASEEREQVVQ